MADSTDINLGDPLQYRLLDGKKLDLMMITDYGRNSAEGTADFLFLIYLYQEALKNRPYSELRFLIAGPGAYPLKGSERVTKEVHESLLYRIAEDIVDRVGIRQGMVAPNPTDETD